MNKLWLLFVLLYHENNTGQFVNNVHQQLKDCFRFCLHLKMGNPWGNSGSLFSTFSDYSENSTVHGVKYITDKVTITRQSFEAVGAKIKSVICVLFR